MNGKKITALVVAAVIVITAVAAVFVFTNKTEIPSVKAQWPGVLPADWNEGIAVPEFSIDTYTGEFTVTDQNGFVWRSNPISGGFDELAFGIERTNQRSLIIVEYLDGESNRFSVNSLAGSVNKGGMSVTTREDGADIVYNFPDLKFSVPLSLTVDSGSFTASIDTSEIKETGEMEVMSVAVLPYFGAGAVGSEGNLVIPDGSGAIIDFKTSNASLKAYEKTVYGDNSVLYKQTESTVEEQIYLPIFGIDRGENSMLGIISEGDGVSLITANVSSGFFTTAAKFVYRQVDSFHLMEGSAKEKEVDVLPKIPTKTDFAVTYLFQNGEKADYVGMAADYRNYLTECCSLKEKESNGISLNLSFTATAEIPKSFLGIPYTGIVALTTLSDIQKIADRLKDEGIENVNLSLKGAFSGGIYGKPLDNVKLEGSVGKLSDYTSLLKKLNKNGSNLYLLANFSRVYKAGNGISMSSGVARDVGGAISYQYEYYPEIFAKDETRKWGLANAESLATLTAKFVKKCDDDQIKLGLYDMAAQLYGDYRMSATYDRAAMQKAHLEAFERLYQKTGDIYFQNANIYALPQSSMLSEVPLTSSQYDMFTADIPLYQTVIHGLCDYSSSAVNLSGNTDEAILKSVEYGSALKYDLICRNSSKVYETSENHLFSSDASVWLDKALSTDGELSAFYRANAGESIIAHYEVDDNVFCTEYSNGNKSIVNYNAEQVVTDGITVEGNNYRLLIKEEGT